MSLKKTVSICLALTLIFGLLAPCGAVLQASATTTLYGEAELEQVTEPVIGESYYLGADVAGTMMYFRHGTVTDTVPYSLVVTDNIDHDWCFQLTLEDSTETSESFEGGFQFMYTHPKTGDPARIYCMDVLKDATTAGQTGVMDTGAHSTEPYKNRHSFHVDVVEGVPLLRKYGNDNVLVIKQVPQTVDGETANVWRMLGVPEAELANEGVYPVMLLKEHTHTYGEATVSGELATRSCTSCGQTQSVYSQKFSIARDIVVGNDYYLAANIGDGLQYTRHGSVSETSPCSLPTSDADHSWVVPITFIQSEQADNGFYLNYTNPSSGDEAYIYCYDSVGSDDIMDTGVNGKNTENHTFYVDEINGVRVLRSFSNSYVLAMKQMAQTVSGVESTGWRMLGVAEAELSDEGVHPIIVLEAHTHENSGAVAAVTDAGHSYGCWCGGALAEVAHTYGEVTANTDNTHSRTCTACGYTNVIYGHDYEQVTTPTIGGKYALAANVNGQLLSFLLNGGYTETSPYSIRTSEEICYFTLEEALEAGKGEFQLVADDGKYIYSIDAGAGATTSSNYLPYPDKVSFLMDQVNGQSVIRAYGTQNVLAAKYSDAKSAWRIWCVAESELANEGVYPVVLLGEHTHTYSGAWTFKEDGTQDRTCDLCGYTDTLYGTDNKVSMVTDPVIGGSYYLTANVGGTLKYFTTGTVTTTAPYSLVTTERESIAVQITLEDSTETYEGFEGGFQLSYVSDDTTSRIYCMDVLKDATIAGQTGIMDTGVNSTTPYKNRHSFRMDEVDGVTVLRKYGNDNVLVVKLNETTGTYRMLGVPASELANEGVYPVMLANAHTHVFGEELHSDETGHWNVCQCGSRNTVQAHHMNQWTLDGDAATQTGSCAACGYTMTVESPYFDPIDDEAELISGLAQIVYDEEAAEYSVEGGNSYYMTAEINGQKYYFRQTSRTADGNAESVTTTAAYSLYSTNDPSHRAIGQLKLVEGNTEGTYILTTTTDKTRVIYVNDEGSDDDIDVGITAFKGASDNATYIARAEALWDETDGYLYHLENDVKYVLVLKELEASYKNSDDEVVEGPVKEMRIAAVPAADATVENGCYILKLEQHVHNYPTAYTTDNDNHWKDCPCGHRAEAAHNVESWTVIAPPTETETGSKEGVCAVCGETVTVETPVTVESWNIVLGDDIGVNFVLALTEGDTVAITVAGEEVPVSLKSNGDGTYKAFISLAAAQMTDEIAISVNGYAVEKTYSVRGYADVILADDDSTYTTYTKSLVRHMLVYGGAAQTYFKHNTENLASNDIEVTAQVPSEAPELEISNGLTGVSCYGVTLLHKEKTAVRFYFNADSIENLTFQADGNIYTPVAKDGRYYIEITGINPQDMDDVIHVVVTDGTNSLAVQYSPLVYIERMYQKANTQALMQAMYGYHLAAKTYLANLYLDDDFAQTSSQASTLYEGVTLYEKTYVAAGYGEVEAYVLCVDADANVELKVSAGAWDETNNGDNPAEAKTVANHFRSVKNAGRNVLAMINGGFFDLNSTGSNLPYGMQVVDSVVKQAPSTNNNYSDNWFGMTTDGTYVISNAAGYESTYVGNVQQAVGGGRMLIENGIPNELTSTDRAYRAAVGVNADGDLVMVAVENATYTDLCHIFVDMGLEITTALNLDGGGSTAMYVPGTYYPKALILGDDGFFPREVADAVAIVEKQ